MHFVAVKGQEWKLGVLHDTLMASTNAIGDEWSSHVSILLVDAGTPLDLSCDGKTFASVLSAFKPHIDRHVLKVYRLGGDRPARHSDVHCANTAMRLAACHGFDWLIPLDFGQSISTGPTNIYHRLRDLCHSKYYTSFKESIETRPLVLQTGVNLLTWAYLWADVGFLPEEPRRSLLDALPAAADAFVVEFDAVIDREVGFSFDLGLTAALGVDGNVKGDEAEDAGATSEGSENVAKRRKGRVAPDGDYLTSFGGAVRRVFDVVDNCELDLSKLSLSAVAMLAESPPHSISEVVRAVGVHIVMEPEAREILGRAPSGRHTRALAEANERRIQALAEANERRIQSAAASSSEGGGGASADAAASGGAAVSSSGDGGGVVGVAAKSLSKAAKRKARAQTYAAARMLRDMYGRSPPE